MCVCIVFGRTESRLLWQQHVEITTESEAAQLVTVNKCDSDNKSHSLEKDCTRSGRLPGDRGADPGVNGTATALEPSAADASRASRCLQESLASIASTGLDVCGVKLEACLYYKYWMLWRF